MKQYVKDYQIIAEIPEGNYMFIGGGVGDKELVFRVHENSNMISVLDIGFGIGHLGALIKSNKETLHWVVDGIDGYIINCYNKQLFDCSYYRNIHHGMAQELSATDIKEYDVICLFDVVEHMSSEDAIELLSLILSSMSDDSFLILSTPLYFMRQNCIAIGDLEEHKIGISAKSLMELRPVLYSVYMDDLFVGSFAYQNSSLKNIKSFVPITDYSFNIEKGMNIAKYSGMVISDDVIVYPPRLNR